MPAQENTALQVNFKTPGGTLINIYVPAGQSAGAYLEAVEGIASQIAALEGVLNAASSAAGITAPPSAQTAPSGPPRPAQPAPSGPPSGGASPTCRHGARVWREGISKSSGKPYKMWSCPSRDRSDQCDPQWVRD